MKTIGIGLSLILLAAPVAAIEVPQTRQEFVKAVASGTRGAHVVRFTAAASFDQVYRLVEKKAAACLDVTVQRSANVGYWERSSSDFNPTVRRFGASKGEFTLQVVHRPRGVGHTPPAGGLYILAADIKSLGGGQTEVVLYEPTIGFKKINRSLKSWLSGEDAPCPKIR